MDKDTKKDGRRQRFVEHKNKVAQIIFDIIIHTGQKPTVEELSERSGISKRSIFRFFKDEEERMTVVHDMVFDTVLSKFPYPKPGSFDSLEKTIEAFVTWRVKIFEFVTPLRTLVEEEKRSKPMVYNFLRKSQEKELKYITKLLEPFIENDQLDDLTLQLFGMCSWGVWTLYRKDRKMSVSNCKKLIEKNIKSLFYRYLS